MSLSKAPKTNCLVLVNQLSAYLAKPAQENMSNWRSHKGLTYNPCDYIAMQLWNIRNCKSYSMAIFWVLTVIRYIYITLPTVVQYKAWLATHVYMCKLTDLNMIKIIFWFTMFNNIHTLNDRIYEGQNKSVAVNNYDFLCDPISFFALKKYQLPHHRKWLRTWDSHLPMRDCLKDILIMYYSKMT